MLLPTLLLSQNQTEYRQILERLDRLEQQNRELLDQIAALRQELAASRPKSAEPAAESAAEPTVAQLSERVAVAEQRIADQAQTKVESSQKFPLRLTGMALFNTYLNSSLNGGSEYPGIASLGRGSERGGATLRQTVIGLEYRGPETLAGGKVHGSLFLDLWGGSGQLLDQNVRLRTASIQIDWKSRSVMAGLEKPIFSPREPNSLAQVWVSPLAGAGNLWLWIPQVRFEQRFSLGEQMRLRAQVGMVGTHEALSYQANPNYTPDFAPTRPGLEGRLEFSYGSPTGRRLEIAPGFHTSDSHVADSSVPSSLVSADWFFNPLSKLEFTGAFFSGKNVAHLGTDGIRQGFVVLRDGLALPIHTQGGWAQWTWLTTPRLSFNFFGGLQDDRDRDLIGTAAARIGKNQKYGANFFYRLAPNVILSFEASQARTAYLQIGNRLNNHYDLALAYLF